MSEESNLPEVPSAKGKGLAGKVMQWLTILTVVGGLGTKEFIFPDFFAKKQNEALVESTHKDVQLQLKNFGIKYTKDSAIFVNTVKSMAVENARIKADMLAYKDLLDANTVQTEFNTGIISITNECVFELLKPSVNTEIHSYKYFYTSDHRDRWNIFDDYYESRVLYAIELRTNNRAYYAPWNRSKIKIQ